MTGKVKWFDDAKGYGFITPDGGGRELFVHHHDIIMHGHRTLADGQRVEFTAQEVPKGLQAFDVVPLDAPPGEG